MKTRLRKLLAGLGAATVVVALGVVGFAQPAVAAADPSFRVTCFPRGMAANDPIVYPGQAGASHMHSFFGAKGVTENTTVDTLFQQQSSQCGNQFHTVDLSAYWIPTLYKDGQAVHSESGVHQLTVYYQRAGGPGGAPVAQALPRGLKMIAGDMRATTPQSNVSYACAHAVDTGRQRGGTAEFLSCNSDEVFIAKLVFPDCWDGKNLDSPDHKSHMAYSSGNAGSCAPSHPVKLPRITFEAWYHGVNGPASSFSWASGGAYTFHGDVITAWNTTAAANLVNQCINVAVDCNPLSYPSIPVGPVSQAQIDAQLTGTTPAAPPATPPAPTPSPGSGHSGGHEATPTPTPTPTKTPSPTTSASPSPTSTSHAHGEVVPSRSEKTAWPGIALSSGAIAILLALSTFFRLIWRWRRR